MPLVEGTILPTKEGTLGNIRIIAFCDTDSPMRFVDIGIPANNKGKQSIGCLFWLLARMVFQMRETICLAQKWDVLTCSSTWSPRKPENDDEVSPQADFGLPASKYGGGDQWTTAAISDPAWPGEAHV
ncbi:hypothetical protein HA466_0222800 [Hirschfeldia incana]|nr:hypothetical protein HA466_0222800 [Hirschfeldia incana]KAJ0240693.1 hypothetical protein HA466_0222800 [Hirschfeldia incana]